MGDAINVDKLTKVYLKIKEQREELSNRYREQDGQLEDQQNTIKSELLKHLQEQNIDSIRTPNGTFYRSVKTKYWTSDWDALVGLCSRGWFTIEKAELLNLLRDRESFFDELITPF